MAGSVAAGMALLTATATATQPVTAPVTAVVLPITAPIPPAALPITTPVPPAGVVAMDSAALVAGALGTNIPNIIDERYYVVTVGRDIGVFLECFNK
ncbi:hypothetical protein H0H87_001032 [Tephrocybe sp. NHM501043]|nr:hypothetical protein H0H87_001032 [Tephrocybe sp. NHM501043]